MTTAYDYIREVIVANMFDGDDHGRTTMQVSQLVDEVAEILSGRYARPVVDGRHTFPKHMESPSIPLILAFHLLFDYKDTLTPAAHYDAYLAVRAVEALLATEDVVVPLRFDDKVE